MQTAAARLVTLHPPSPSPPHLTPASSHATVKDFPCTQNTRMHIHDKLKLFIRAGGAIWGPVPFRPPASFY